MPDNHDAGVSVAVIESIAGLTAGAVATLVVHPLDIVKTRMQLSRISAGPSLSQTSRISTVSLLRSLTSNPQPVASLYRGLTPNLVGNATSWASFFFFKSRFESLIAYWRASGVGQSSTLPKRPVASDYFVASLLSGCATAALTNPIWVIKTRMLASDKAAKGAYPSMTAGVKTILRTEGIGGFYRGLAVSLIGVSHAAVQFAVYEPAKQVYFARRAGSVDESRPKGPSGAERMSTEATLVISSIAKLVAGAVTYPHQVLRSRLQNYQADEKFGKGFRAVVRKTWMEEGIPGFYRGLVPGVIRVMPATWVTFLVYENMKYHLPRWLS